MKKLMAVFVLLLVSAVAFSAAAFSVNAADTLKNVGSNGLKISESAVESEDYEYADGILTIKSDKPITISGGTDEKNPLYDEVIVVNSPLGANITLRNAYLQVKSGSKFAAFEIDEVMSNPVTITLEGDNLLKSTTSDYAGLQKNGDSCKLIINGSGKLTAIAGIDGACIGGAAGRDSGNIEISGSVEIIAENDRGNGAGIGGGGSSSGNGGNGSNITISDNAKVTATGYGGGAGIGGGGAGYGRNGGDGIGIKVTGGEVTATGGSSGGAGIGGGSGSGYGSKGGDGIGIKITDGEVKATGGGYSSGGAGIGGGGGNGGNGGGEGDNKGITISGGKVIATGGMGGACIGGGYQKKGVNITIEGGTVEAAFQYGSNLGACIGGGYGGDAENIKITGGTVNAYNPGAPAIGSGGGAGSVNGIYISGDADVIAAANGGAGIGCGNNSSTSEAKNIEIFGSATVRAYSMNHAGIGGTGSAKTVDTIKIYGDANVTAISGNGAAGIGGSNSSNQEVKNISIYGNAKVTAIAGYSGAGIGGGAWNSNSTTSGISISGNATVVATGNVGGAGIGSGGDDTATDITISENATVIASSAYNKDLYDPSIYETTLTITGYTITYFSNGSIGEWLDGAFHPSGTGVGIGSNKTNECVITIEGGTVTAYGNTKPGIGGDNADVTIKGKSSTSWPLVSTNEIKSTTDPADYPDEYWGIVFEGITNNDFMEGIVYGKNKTVEITDSHILDDEQSSYVLGTDKKLTVLSNVTFKPSNKFTLDGSTLYLKEDATLDKWYEMEKINGGEIQHEDSSDYKWYYSDEKKLYDGATLVDPDLWDDVSQLYTNDKTGREGIVLCDICGEPEPHAATTDDWVTDPKYHWKVGECELGEDCSTKQNTIESCSYTRTIGGKTVLDYGVHRYPDEPDEIDGDTRYYYCIDCHYLKTETGSNTPTPKPTGSNPTSRTGIIMLYKVDSADGSPLEGAKFGLYSDEECTSLIKSAVSEMDGGNAVVSFKVSAGDTYYIKEISAPSGYRLSGKVFRAKVSSGGTVTYSVVGSAGSSEDIPVCENVKGIGNPGTAAGVGVAGIAVMSGIVCIVSLAKKGRKRQH